jgi:RNA polymerase sigma-70 factor (ECF subfamily)
MVISLEAEWLERALKGDDQAFTLIVETYQTPVYNLCYRMLGDTGEAEDAAQETFWRAYQALSRYDTQRSFTTWMLSIAAHYCIDQQRKRRMPTLNMDLLLQESIADGAPIPEQTVARREQDRLLHSLLADLPAQDRAAIILRYWYDLPEDEIAQTLSLTVSAVKSRLYRTRQMLAQRWRTILPTPLREERIPHESPAL